MGRRNLEEVRQGVGVARTVVRRRLVGLVEVRRVVGVVRMVARRVVVALRRLVAQVVVRPGLAVAHPVAVALPRLVAQVVVRPRLAVGRRVAVARRLLGALPGHQLREARRDLRAWCSRPAWPRRHRRRSPC